MISRRLVAFVAAAAVVAALGSACGSAADDPAPTQEPPADRSSSTGIPAGASATTAPDKVDSARFVFGALPGKPVVYWIHTDW